ncbi:MAG: hypothetical protein AAGE37_06895 [Pseudomonadota bacterium]
MADLAIARIVGGDEGVRGIVGCHPSGVSGGGGCRKGKGIDEEIYSWNVLLITEGHSRILARLRKINRIFKQRGWHGEVGEDGPLDDAWNECSALAEELTDDQFELFTNLLSNFKKIEPTKIFRSSCRMFECFLEDSSFRQRTFVFPIVKKSDLEKQKPKSSIGIPYYLEHTVAANPKKYKDKEIKFFQSIQELDKIDDFDIPVNLVLVDDFIGTGDTVDLFIQENQELLDIFDAKIAVVATACLQEGKEKIEALGHTVFAEEILPKGIQENDLLPDKDRAYAIYNEIEAKIKVSPLYKRGYKQSEALISMVNTPNNTFPIFWYSNRPDGSKWPALFPRRRVHER